jgi:hypothetical protein
VAHIPADFPDHRLGLLKTYSGGGLMAGQRGIFEADRALQCPEARDVSSPWRLGWLEKGHKKWPLGSGSGMAFSVVA